MFFYGIIKEMHVVSAAYVRKKEHTTMSSDHRATPYIQKKKVRAEPPFSHRILRLLDQRRYEIPGWGFVVCRLWRIESGSPRGGSIVFAVELCGLGNRRLCTVGDDGARARRIFDLLVEHTVTPFGLRDVLEEL